MLQNKGNQKIGAPPISSSLENHKFRVTHWSFRVDQIKMSFQKEFEGVINMHLKEIQYLVNTGAISVEEGKTLSKGVGGITEIVEVFHDFNLKIKMRTKTKMKLTSEDFDLIIEALGRIDDRPIEVVKGKIEFLKKKTERRQQLFEKSNYAASINRLESLFPK